MDIIIETDVMNKAHNRTARMDDKIATDDGSPRSAAASKVSIA
ncbi:unnamed protein product [Debaryomyces tyrocola]|nr:unnamed protein product [Debaryomyces tyrocola]